jgi:hypothetical protein
LKTLDIKWCDKLTGLTEDEASDEQSAPERNGTFLPRLESLVITFCYSLVQLPNLSAPLKTLRIEYCDSLKPMSFGQHQETAPVNGGGGVVQRVETTSSLMIAAGSSSNEDESTVSTAKLSSSSARSNHCFFPCLESLEIIRCDGLTEVANLPPSLEVLIIYDCPCLESFTITSGPHHVYSSLRALCIRNCHGIKQLPPSLHLQQQRRLNHHLQGNLYTSYAFVPPKFFNFRNCTFGPSTN